MTEGAVSFESKSTKEEIFVSAGESVTATVTGLSQKTKNTITPEQERWNQEKKTIEEKPIRADKKNSKMFVLIGPIVAGLILIVIVATVFKKRK